MATGDMVARLLLDSRAFDASIKKAREGSKVFGNDISRSFEKVTRGVTAFSTAVVAALEIYNAFKEWGKRITETDNKMKDFGDNVSKGLEEIRKRVKEGIFTGLSNGIGEAVVKIEQLSSVLKELGKERQFLDFSILVNNSRYKELFKLARNSEGKQGEKYVAELKKILKSNTKFAGNRNEVLLAEAEALIRRAIGRDVEVSEDFLLSVLQTSPKSKEVLDAIDRANHYISQDAAMGFKKRSETLKAYQLNPDTKIVGETMEIRALGLEGQKSAAATPRELLKEYNNDLIVAAVWRDMSLEDREKLTELLASRIASLETIRDQELEIIDLEKEIKAKKKGSAKTITPEEIKWRKEKYPFNTARVKAGLEEGFNRDYTGLSGNFAPWLFGNTLGMRGNIDTRVPQMPHYEGEYAWWNFVQNPIANVNAGAKIEGMAKLPWNEQDLIDMKLTAWVEENRKEMEEWSTSIDLLGNAFRSLGESIGGTTGELFTFIGGLLDAAQQMLPLIAQIMAETEARKANASAAATEAAAKSMSAYAGIPFAGIALGLTAVAAVIAAIQNVPKFAEGGIVTSATLGVFGEAGPEAVMPLDRLEEFVASREVRVTGNIKASGKELVVVLDNYNRVRNG